MSTASIMRPPLSSSVQRLVISSTTEVVVGEGHGIALGHAPLIAIELQPDDAAEHLVAQRIVRDGDHAAEQRRRKDLEQGPRRASAIALGLGHRCRPHRAS